MGSSDLPKVTEQVSSGTGLLGEADRKAHAFHHEATLLLSLVILESSLIPVLYILLPLGICLKRVKGL